MAKTKTKPPWLYPLIAVLILFSLFTYLADPSENSNNLTEEQRSSENIELSDEKYLVTRVKDGDTIVLSEVGTIRLIGIDTPELSGDECFSNEATEYLTERILEQEVKIVYDESQGLKDRYDRTLGYIFYEDENINLELVRNGYAKEYTYSKPYIFQKEFRSAEELAKKEQLGLWKNCDF